MKKIASATLVCLSLASFSTGLLADQYVQGYTRSDGTYVQPHYRSSKDSSFNNNWSTKGNVNPYTGERGYKTPRYSAPSYSTPSYGTGASRTYEGNSYKRY